MSQVRLIIFICVAITLYANTSLADTSVVVEVEGNYSGHPKAVAEYNARAMAVQKALDRLPSVVFGDESLRSNGDEDEDYSLEVRSVMATVADVDVLELRWVGDNLKLKARVTLDYDRTLRMLTGISTSVDMGRQLKRTHDRYIRALEQLNAPERPRTQAERSSVDIGWSDYLGLLPSQIKQEELRRELKQKIEGSLDRLYRVELPALRSIKIEVLSVQAEHIDFILSSPGFEGYDAPCVRSPQILSIDLSAFRLSWGKHEYNALAGVRLPLRIRLFSDDNDYSESKQTIFYSLDRAYNRRSMLVPDADIELSSHYTGSLRELFKTSGLGAYRGRVPRPDRASKESGMPIAMMWAGSVSLDVYASTPDLLLNLFVADFRCPYFHN
ncbi:hypothetical protein [Aliidiomarina quisquiliarum]|uniref:hypothetical protein n=1 Tax=Aliidiomarina quisquiliarum TaxID=2938947 RepID=UPI00208F8D29|nr:hypothetical protein [Aliidiomarina quisquiliarum]MCO4320034.1 hypothetical protein [Aliidiomarina quisquiliarum]